MSVKDYDAYKIKFRLMILIKIKDIGQNLTFSGFKEKNMGTKLPGYEYVRQRFEMKPKIKSTRKNVFAVFKK